MFTFTTMVMHFVLGAALGSLAFATTLSAQDIVARRFYQAAIVAGLLFMGAIAFLSTLAPVTVETELLADCTMSGIGTTLAAGLAVTITRRSRRRSFR